MTPEQQARASIDAQLETAGWHICDADKANIHAAHSATIRAFPFTRSGALTYFNTKPIAAMPVLLPSLEEQKVFAQKVESRLSVAEKIELAVDANLKRAERLCQSILKQAFSGRLM